MCISPQHLPPCLSTKTDYCQNKVIHNSNYYTSVEQQESLKEYSKIMIQQGWHPIKVCMFTISVTWTSLVRLFQTVP